MMNNSRSGEDLYTTFNSVHRTSRRNERQMIHAPSMQALPILMAFLEKEKASDTHKVLQGSMP